MKSINIHEAKTHLSRLVERVQAGEEIIIAKAGRPPARLVPIEGTRMPVRIGGLKPGPVPDDFNTLFEEEIAAQFGGGAATRPARRRK